MLRLAPYTGRGHPKQDPRSPGDGGTGGRDAAQLRRHCGSPGTGRPARRDTPDSSARGDRALGGRRAAAAPRPCRAHPGDPGVFLGGCRVPLRNTVRRGHRAGSPPSHATSPVTPPMTDTARVLVVIPAYNEAPSLEGVIRGVRAAVPEATVAVVNDGSTDATGAVGERLGAVVLHL